MSEQEDEEIRMNKARRKEMEEAVKQEEREELLDRLKNLEELVLYYHTEFKIWEFSSPREVGEWAKRMGKLQERAEYLLGEPTQEMMRVMAMYAMRASKVE